MTTESRVEQLRQEWTDQFIEVVPGRPELARFVGIVGRVVTVNWNGMAVIDFQDGGWYDLAASEEHLRKLGPAGAARYKNVNSAQPIPEKQA